MTPHLPRTLAAVLGAVAALAAAGTASASAPINDPALNVPADKIEHVVTEFRTTGTAAARHTIDELYLGSDKSHWISRDARTHRLLSETTFDHGHAQTYDARTHTVERFDDDAVTPPWQTLAQEGAIWKDAFTSGKTRQTGTTTALGRPALVLESVPGKWTSDEPSSRTTMVVDAETFVPYVLKTVLPKQGFTQVQRIRSFETLDRTATTERLFALGKHPAPKRHR